MASKPKTIKQSQYAKYGDIGHPLEENGIDKYGVGYTFLGNDGKMFFRAVIYYNTISSNIIIADSIYNYNDKRKISSPFPVTEVWSTSLHKDNRTIDNYTVTTIHIPKTVEIIYNLQNLHELQRVTFDPDMKGILTFKEGTFPETLTDIEIPKGVKISFGDVRADHLDFVSMDSFMTFLFAGWKATKSNEKFIAAYLWNLLLNEQSEDKHRISICINSLKKLVDER